MIFLGCFACFIFYLSDCPAIGIFKIIIGGLHLLSGSRRDGVLR